MIDRKPTNRTENRNSVNKNAKLGLVAFALLLLLSVSALAALPVQLSSQGTGARDKSTGALIGTGNITVQVWDALSAGNIIYNETFTNSISNGSWNVMLGEGTQLLLEFGKVYYKDYQINGEDVSFTNSTGGVIGRQLFYSPLGDVNSSDVAADAITDATISDDTNLTLAQKITFALGEVIDNIVDGWIRIDGNLNITGNITVNGTAVCLEDGTNCQSDDAGPWTNNSNMVFLKSGYPSNVNVSGTLYASNISSNSPLQLQTAGVTRIYVNDSTGNVGIGTTVPGSTLSVLGNAKFGSSNNIANGTNSFATGDGNVASGEDSFAVGSTNTASGERSIVLGDLSTSNGQGSIATGTGTISSGDYSITAGKDTFVVGSYSVAMGRNINVTGFSSFAFGGTGSSGDVVSAADTFVLGTGVKMGIGVMSPAQALVVSGDLNVTGISYLGNVVIDADNITVNNIIPKDGGDVDVVGNLDVTGDLNVTGTSYVGTLESTGLNVNGDLNVTGVSYLGNVVIDADNITANAIISKTGDIKFYNSTGSEIVVMKDNGRLGVGVSAPTELLDIIGDDPTIHIGNASYGATITSEQSTGEIRISQDGTGFTELALQQDGDLILTGGTGKIGVGTSSPTSALHVIGDGNFSGTVYASNVSSNSPLRLQTNGTTRIFINDTNGAIAMSNTASATGTDAVAIGVGTIANGTRSVAIGYLTVASNDESTALGRETTASGTQSTAMGHRGIASEYGSVAMGIDTIASGQGSIAMGDTTRATGTASIAMGLQTDAEGRESTAMGRYINVSGQNSFGYGGSDSAADIVSANDSFVIGTNVSVGIGVMTPTSALHVSGDTNITGSLYVGALESTGLTVNGNLNVTGTSYLGDVTIDADNITVNNIIPKDNGIVAVIGNANVTGTLYASNVSSNSPLRLQTSGTTRILINDSNGAIALSNESTATGKNALASGSSNASGIHATAFGLLTTASGSVSTAMGQQTTASATQSTAMGSSTTASGQASTATGSGTTASGDFSIAMGDQTTASGDISTAIGRNTEAEGLNSVAMGRYINVSSTATNSFGYGGSGSASDIVTATDVFVVGTGVNVGIGVMSPTSALHVSGNGNFSGTVYATNISSNSPLRLQTSGTTRILINDSTGAISMSSSASATGTGSVATGSSSVASGSNSMAIGLSTTASGDNSMAMGSGTNASGLRAVAMGRLTTASGTASVAMGLETNASGDYSLATGYQTNASGLESTAMGRLIKVSGSNSFGFGGSGSTSDIVTANDAFVVGTGLKVGIGVMSPTSALHVSGDGNFTGTVYASNISSNSPLRLQTGGVTRVLINDTSGSIVIGTSTTASGTNSFAGGNGADADGDRSFAFGNAPTASGANSVAIGSSTTASGSSSIAMGVSAVASNTGSFASGQSTISSGAYSTAMGSGTNATNNYAMATGYRTIASGIASTAMGSSTTALGDNSTAMGSGTTASGKGAVTMGLNTVAGGVYSLAGGWLTNASGDYSVAMGINTKATSTASAAFGQTTTASGGWSIAMGDDTTASGQYSTAMGRSTTASSDYSMATGRDTIASNTYATAIGYQTNASGIYAFSSGYRTSASGSYSVAMGDRSIATGNYDTALGQLSVASGGGSFAVGSGSDATGTVSIAMGSDAQATGLVSFATGQLTRATGTYSTAMGRNAKSSGDNSFAWGNDNCLSGQTSCNNTRQGVFAVFGGFCVSNSTTVCPDIPDGDIRFDGSSTSFDIAEGIPTSHQLEKGDVVIADGNVSVGHTSKPYDSRVAGIISTSPNIVFNFDGDKNEFSSLGGLTDFEIPEDLAPLSLAGRVPVKICLENGAISIGDSITSSSTEGHAMKWSLHDPEDATDFDELKTMLSENEKRRNAVIGKALEVFDGSSPDYVNERGEACGKIMVLVTLQ